ncbi:hypothetical protein B7P43_G02281 [Cryptotermes secundus]|uniref:Uncharacterized protein n=1 Tax=Cryptotermes secundus TaxID=105785 RepID=A0A2J7RTI1_9NEOP|nr:hypothetical protein B7P43_G02281 [Cryptotermes secundus]
MRDVRLLLQCSVHSEQSTEKIRHVNKGFCGGMGSLRILGVCVNGKARGDQYSVLKLNESFIVTLYFK